MTVSAPETIMLDALINSPRLPFYAQRIHTLLIDEAGRRAHFIDNVLENEKFVIPVRAIFDNEVNQSALRQLLEK